MFELVTGIKGVPSEKLQRVGILSLRKDRLTRRLRCILHIPTEIMLADSLTKIMVSGVFMRFCATGKWTWDVSSSLSIRVKHGLKKPQSFSEADLINLQP